MAKFDEGRGSKSVRQFTPPLPSRVYSPGKKSQPSVEMSSPRIEIEEVAMPEQNDKVFWPNGVFDEDAYTTAYYAWEEQNDARLRAERERRWADEEASIQKAKEIVENEVIVPEKKTVRFVVEQTKKVSNSKSKIKLAQVAINNIMTGNEFMIKSEVYNNLEKKVKPVKCEVEKIRIHCDYKEKVQLTSAEEKKVETLKSVISTLDVKIENREKQVCDSENKAERISEQIEATEQKYDDELERLRMEYEAKCRAIEIKRKLAIDKLETEKKKSVSYAEGVKTEIRKLEAEKDLYINKIDEKTKPKIKLTMTDYTKLRQIKSKQLEHCQMQLDAWYSELRGYDDDLEREIETHYGREIHKIDEDELIGINWLRDKWDYEGLYNKMSRQINSQLREVNDLLDRSEAISD